MDITYIHGLKINTIIGIFDWERQQPQELIIDIDMGTDFSDAIKTDHINSCVDYTLISKAIIDLAHEHSYQLIESFAEKISQIILKQFKVHWVKIKINKPMAIKEAQSIGVLIERTANNIP